MASIEWKRIPGYENYRVSSDGRIFGCKRRKLLKPILNNRGYLTVCIPKTLTIHRLVAKAFLGNSNGLHVNHKNGIKTDNRVENLEYVTNRENMAHAFRIGIRNNNGENHPRASLSDKQVIEIRKIGYAKTNTQLAIQFNCGVSVIDHIRKGHTWKHLIT